MKRATDSVWAKSHFGILFLFLVFAAIIVFSTGRSISLDRRAGAKLLHRIYANTLAYRLAELEYVLSFEKKEKDEYLNRMESVLQQLERDQSELGAFLDTDKEQSAYAAFSADWDAYLHESNAMLASSKEDPNPQAIAAIAEQSRAMYEKSSRSLDTLVEANGKCPESWTDLKKIFFKENRLSLNFLYICGFTGLLIFIFNLYGKAKRREIDDKI